MHVVVVSLGTRGDAQPYIALAKAMQRKGHRVTFACSPDHRAFSEKHGVPFRSIGGSFYELLETEKGRAWLESGDSISRYVKTTRALFEDTMLDTARFFATAVEDADLVTGHPYCWGAFMKAEKRGVPFVLAPLWAFVPNGDVQIGTLPGWRWLRRFVWRKAIGMIDELTYEARASFRREHGLSPAEPDYYPDLVANGTPYVHLFSESILRRPSDWPSNIQVGGACILDDETPPPSDLVDFLASGPPPIYVGYGSMTGRDPEQLTKLTVAAIAQTKQRAVIVTGWGGVDRNYLQGDVLALDSVSHAWLFPRMKALVHHGGAGTTTAGLRAGRPTQVVSFFGDQPAWGKLLADLGAGPPPLHRTKLTVESLARGIERVISHAPYATTAEAIAAKMMKEPGADEAAAKILAAATTDERERSKKESRRSADVTA